MGKRNTDADIERYLKYEKKWHMVRLILINKELHRNILNFMDYNN